MENTTRTSISMLLTDPDAGNRRSAAEALRASEDHGAVQALAMAFQDENKGVRDAASRSILTVDRYAAATAVAHYIKEKDIVIRNLAAKILMQLGRETIHALVPFLRDPDKDVRKFAVDILGAIGDDEATYYLVPLLKDTDPNVVVAVLEAMGNIRSTQVLPQIIDVYRAHPYTRASAAEALGKIGDENAARFLFETATSLLSDPDADPVELHTVMEGIGAVGRTDMVPALTEAMPVLSAPLRQVLLHAVVRIAERFDMPLALPAGSRTDLLDMLAGADIEVQLSAVKALGPAAGEDVTRGFIRILGRSDDLDFLLVSHLIRRDDVFRLAVEALDEHDVHAAAPVLLLLTKLAIEMMGGYAALRAFPVDGEMLSRAFDAAVREWDEADQETQSIIVDAMFALDGDRAAVHMDQVMAAPDPWLRVHAIELLGQLRKRHALDLVARFLEDEEEMVRETAQMVLQAHGYPLPAMEF